MSVIKIVNQPCEQNCVMLRPNLAIIIDENLIGGLDWIELDCD